MLEPLAGFRQAPGVDHRPIDRPAVPPGPAFLTTRWSVVWRARNDGSAAASEAREQLCSVYWPCIYAYLRRCGHGPHDAQDLTQEFLHRFLEKDWLKP